MKSKNGGIKLLHREVKMTEGPILPAVIRFAVPLILSSILQTLYNAADVMVVGNFAGKEAVAAVGATTSIIGLLINIFVSIASGFNIIMARVLGANDGVRIRRAISTSYTFSLILGVAVAIFGFLMAEPMLAVTGCPENVREGATLYMRIYMLSVPATMFYNFMSGVIRINGDSKRPFIYLAISGLVNIVLNVVLILATGEAVASVAVATVVATYVSAVMLFIRLVRMEPPCKLYPTKLALNSQVLLKIIRFGVPAAISSATFALTNIQIQSAINSFGDVGISGNTASGSIEGFIFAVTNTAVIVVSAFLGQNIGADKRDRVVKCLWYSYAAYTVAAVVMSLVCFIFGRQLLGVVLPDEPEAVEFALVRFKYICLATLIHGAITVTNGSLQAFGYTMYQMIVNLIGTCGFRFIWMAFIYPLSPTPDLLYMCYPISYAFVFIVGFAMNLYLVRKYKKGKTFEI